jgi:hypothetical protein
MPTRRSYNFMRFFVAGFGLALSIGVAETMVIVRDVLVSET